MNDNRIEFLLSEIDHDIDNDSYVFGINKINELHVAVRQLREKLNNEYQKIRDTMTL